MGRNIVKGLPIEAAVRRVQQEQIGVKRNLMPRVIEFVPVIERNVALDIGIAESRKHLMVVLLSIIGKKSAMGNSPVIGVFFSNALRRQADEVFFRRSVIQTELQRANSVFGNNTGDY